MKIEFKIGVFAVIVVSVGIGYIICTKKNVLNETRTTTNEFTSEGHSTVSVSDEMVYTEDNNFIQERQSAADNIKHRHALAAKEMKESLKNIYDKDKVVITDNSVILENIMADLDLLLAPGDSNE